MRFASLYEQIFLIALLFSALCDRAPTNLGLRKLEEDKNFIKVQYKVDTTYPKGFGNNYRKGIDHIKKGDTTFQVDQELSIGANEIIEIFFSQPIKDLTMFFGNTQKDEGDANNKNIISVDFTNFDSSMVQKVNSMFYGCSSIEEIDFDNFETSGEIEDMDYMFYNCESLKVIELSELKTSSVKTMNSMFAGCSSLTYLYISIFDMTNLEKAEDMFDKLAKLEYINIYNIKTSNTFNIAISKLNEKNGLIACQKDEIITGVANKCCPLYKETNTCSENINNYIKIKYNKDVSYPYGFGYIEYDKSPNKYRSEVVVIKTNKKIYQPDEALDILAKKEVEIYFNSSLVNLTKFFYYYDDPNVENIISINLEFFNSSLLESMESAFSGCTSLESIDLTNFKAPLLTNMNNAFFHCSSLKAIDLSNIISSSITFTNRIFCGCNSLKLLILENLNLANVEDASYAFYNVKNLKYLNILDLKANDIFKNEILGQYGLNEENSIVVCQNEKEKMITNPNYQYICCNYNNNECECTNNIIIYYKEKTEYATGFIYGNGTTEIETRKDISYIYIDDNIYSNNYPLNIRENSSVKLCFKSPISSLENFFKLDADSNEPKNIRSIDLSHFDSSSLNNIGNIFYNCSGLVALDMSNLNIQNVNGISNMFNNNNNLRYIVLKNTNISEKESLGLDDTIIICRDDNTLQNITNPNICCDFDLEYSICRTNNYITVNFSKSIDYSQGFSESNTNRNSISFINYNNITYGINKITTINKNDIIELHFLEPITNLSSFFKGNNIEEINYVDFSHFDSSLIQDISSMFENCVINEINFTNFNTTLITNMANLFNGSSNLISLDLSNFNTSSVTSMENMFSNMKLKSLYLSNFNTSSVTTMKNMFNNCDSLKILDISNLIIDENCDTENMFLNLPNLIYISLINVTIQKGQVFSVFDNKTNLMVCQSNDNYIQTSNRFCCDINNNHILCKTDNYIKVKFKRETNYPNGFISYYYFRRGINFTNLRNSTIIDGEPLNIEKDEILELHFIKPINSFEYFFYSGQDSNTKNIISIDFSHFDSSLITYMFYSFGNCESLEEIDFTNFNTSKVTNMQMLFMSCYNLLSLDLSNFDTSSVTFMFNMFYDCSSLKYLDISHFNFSLAGQTGYIGYFGQAKIKYINLYYITPNNEDIYNNIISGSTKSDLIVCKDGEAGEEIINICNKTFYSYPAFNYIKINYKDESNTNEGRILNFLENNEGFSIRAGNSLEIHYNYFLIYLNNTFSCSSNKDIFNNNILSLDFSHLDTSHVITMKSMLYGCNSIEKISDEELNNFINEAVQIKISIRRFKAISLGIKAF